MITNDHLRLSKTWLTAIATGILLSACTDVSPPKWQAMDSAGAGAAIAPPAPIPPPAPREFRAAWVSTVANIDWPSKNTLTVVEQQAELIAIVDRAKAMNLNALVLQVRPSADAIYPSALEPWTEYLTGAQGKAPSPLYDPLKMWVDEAHKRGIELHAWFNPYRARHKIAKSPNAANHIINTQPQAVKVYGEYTWMDPAEPAAVKQTLDVILDVVRRYDIDGVHIDDYFYPYPIAAPDATKVEPTSVDGATPPVANRELDFPDEPAWQRYLSTGGTMSRADWRRAQVNGLIEKIYNGIHAEKSWVRFGISPFGIAKPDRRTPDIAGFSQYDKLYADAELWLENGWLDYFTPQLYWAIDQKGQSFPVLLDYWMKQNPKGRHMWPGLYTSRIQAAPVPDPAKKNFSVEEIVKQVEITRSRTAPEIKDGHTARGHVHFSMVALMQNRQGITDTLQTGVYNTPALVPTTPWLSKAVPATPTLVAAAQAAFASTSDFRITPAPASTATQFAIWSRYGGQGGDQWRFSVQPVSVDYLQLPNKTTAGVLNTVVVTAVDRLGNESAPTVFQTVK